MLNLTAKLFYRILEFAGAGYGSSDFDGKLM